MIRAQGWETIDDRDRAAAHLCPKCIRLKDRGELASNPLDCRCFRCDATPADGIKQWWRVPGEDGDAVVVCDDCYDEDQDAFIVP